MKVLSEEKYQLIGTTSVGIDGVEKQIFYVFRRKGVTSPNLELYAEVLFRNEADNVSVRLGSVNGQLSIHPKPLEGKNVSEFIHRNALNLQMKYVPLACP